jgi:hypothetical protein
VDRSFRFGHEIRARVDHSERGALPLEGGLCPAFAGLSAGRGSFSARIQMMKNKQALAIERLLSFLMLALSLQLCFGHDL